MRWTPEREAAAACRSLVRLAAVALALLLPATARAQFSAQPVILNMAPADSAATATVSVRNDGTREQQFRFHTADFDQTDDGDHSFLPLGEHAATCKGRVRVFPDGATLRPGERQEVRVHMEPGAKICWGVLFVETVSRDPSAGGINISQQIAVKVYGIPPRSAVEGEITGVTATPAAGALKVALDFRNSGGGPVRPAGTLEIRTLTGEVVKSIQVEAFSVLPGRTRRVVLEVPSASLGRGRYVAVPILDFGADYLAGGQAAFQVP